MPRPGCHGDARQCDEKCAELCGEPHTGQEPEAVPGCTDEAAVNYAEDATEDNGSCFYRLTRCISESHDDVEANAKGLFGADGTLEITKSDKGKKLLNRVGLRFNDIPLEKGMYVSKSHIVMHQAGPAAQKKKAKFIIAVENGNAKPFCKKENMKKCAKDLKKRKKFKGKAKWKVSKWDSKNGETERNTPDLSRVINGFLNKGKNWEKGNSLGFVIWAPGKKPKAGPRVVESFDTDPLKAPCLVVEYYLTQAAAQGAGLEDADPAAASKFAASLLSADIDSSEPLDYYDYGAELAGASATTSSLACALLATLVALLAA